MRISVWANGADGVDGKFILLPFLLFGAPRKQFRIWNFVTKVFSTVPSSGLNMNDLSRVWPIRRLGIVSAGGRYPPYRNVAVSGSCTDSGGWPLLHFCSEGG